jgi:ABC-type uncharacterized transport system fused permease/ATPase subunit
MTGQKVVRVEKIVQIQVIPRTLAGRIFTVVLAVLGIALMFFFFAVGIALIGLLVAIAIGRLLWLSMKRQSR